MLLDFPLSVGSGNFRFFPSGKGEGAVFLQYFFALSREGDLDFIAHSSIIQRYSAPPPILRSGTNETTKTIILSCLSAFFISDNYPLPLILTKCSRRNK